MRSERSTPTVKFGDTSEQATWLRRSLIKGTKVPNPQTKKSSKTRVHWGRLMVAIISVFLIMEGVLAFGRKILLERRIHERLLGTKAELNRLADENLRLRKEKEALYTPEKIEKLAREKLDLTKPDEIAVKVISKDTTSQTQPEKGKTSGQSKSFWEKLKEEPPLIWLLR